MAGRGWGSDQGEDAAIGVSERSLFAPRPTPLPPPSPLVPDPGKAPLQADVAASVPVAETGRIVRVRRQISLTSLPRLRHSVNTAASLELDRGVAFLLVPVCLAIGAIGYFSLTAEPDFARPVAVVILTGICALVSRSWPKTHLCFMAALLCALGLLAAKVETWRAGTQMLGSEISTQVTGRVVSLDRMETGRIRLTIDVTSTARPKLRYAPERVRLSARKIPADVTAGSLITGYAKLLPPTGPVRPDSYDFSFDSYFAGIGGSGFFLGNPKLVVSDDGDMPLPARISSSVENAREAIADHIRASVGGAEGEIAAALIVGVRAGIPDDINEAMRRTGIYHIISISGLHMALVAGTIMGLLRGAFALFPDFSARRPVKKYAAFAALFSIAAYLIISGVVVAAERSFIMLAVMLIAVLFDRAALTMRNLAISAIAVIVVSPHEVVGPSFQMSFAATAALVGAYAGWADHRAGKARPPPPKRSMPGFLTRKFVLAATGLAMTSIIAGSATTLFAIWHFQRVSPLSLFANLAVMPIVTVVMFLAVASALLMPFGLDWPALYLMGKGLTVMIAISGWISERSPVDGVGLISQQSVLLVTIALVIATMATTWLRLAALPFALAGLLTVSDTRTPDVLISEDARLVALPIGGGELAVSRERPNEFTVDNWKRALTSETIVVPEVFDK
ncbi:ComEC/Rec2 family competence protein, partial [Mesorhizobium sp. M7A.T.Ca.US.000.02.1.1]|uniref:ComEC/Rec2 family competence protein n=3 Tax=unclassified Mesorhizobium TaxID=325217 RepID=UPI000FD5A7D1